MARFLTRLIVLIPIALVVVAIYRLEQRWTTTPEPNVVYVNPGFKPSVPAPTAP
jgi:hypothetical protein